MNLAITNEIDTLKKEKWHLKKKSTRQYETAS